MLINVGELCVVLCTHDAGGPIVARVGVTFVYLVLTSRTRVPHRTVAYVTTDAIIGAEHPLRTGASPLTRNQVWTHGNGGMET